MMFDELATMVDSIDVDKKNWTLGMCETCSQRWTHKQGDRGVPSDPSGKKQCSFGIQSTKEILQTTRREGVPKETVQEVSHYQDEVMESTRGPVDTSAGR